MKKFSGKIIAAIISIAAIIVVLLFLFCCKSKYFGQYSVKIDNGKTYSGTVVLEKNKWVNVVLPDTIKMKIKVTELKKNLVKTDFEIFKDNIVTYDPSVTTLKGSQAEMMIYDDENLKGISVKIKITDLK